VDVEAAIRARRTHKQYGPQPVSNETLRALLDLARFAPNHKLTQPWRFRVLGPAIRAQIEALAGEQEAVKLRRAPTLVLATAVLSGDPLADEEDLHATACAVYAVLLGLGGWLSQGECLDAKDGAADVREHAADTLERCHRLKVPRSQ